MPESIAAPPAPAAAPPAGVPAAAPSPAAAPEIKVSQMTPSASPAKPGSARARMNAELRKKGTLGAPQAPEPTEAPTVAPAATPPAETPPAPAGDEAAAPAAEAAPAVDPKTGKPAKVNPWKLVDEYKAKTAKLEAELVESGKRAIPKEQWEASQQKMTATEKRAQELEDEIRYVNYSKSKEFQDKHQVPYEASWKRAMGDLKDVQIQDGDIERTMNATDLLELVNMPLQRARAEAEKIYGPIANDVMNHRNEIRRLYDEQASALDEARKNGSAREKERTEKFQREYGEMSKRNTEHWQKSNEAATRDAKYGKFFTPVEGDEHGNQRLAKGYELADRAFSENPTNPGLTAEQQRSIIERHAAIRNRAAAFGRLVYQNEQHTARIAELEKELKEFKTTVPPLGGSLTPATTPEATGFSRIRAGLEKIAK